LDWIPEAPSAPFFVALEKGYFAAEGLQVTIEPGRGSAVSVANVADGSFDLGYADINSMMEFNDKNPDKSMLAIAVIYNVAPFTIFTLKSTNIKEPKDLIGKKLGAPAGDAARRLWPLFARLTTIDPTAVEWVTLEPAQREAALARGEVDAISGFYSTSWFSLVKNKVSRSEIVTIKYSDYGLALYGNSIVASTRYLKDNPEAARAFLRALARGWKDTLADPKSAIETLKRANPNIDTSLELRRLEQVIFLSYLTAEVKQVGFGQIVPDRLTRNIDLITEGFGLQTKPVPAAVFTDAYLPPLSDRLP
jgi:NitT/TauT family transport system substrate-binding protein